ncbi:MAG: oligosaccharide flippase family protein [Anaerolineaceae bacterium]|nr:oligosaccharide flippase family protein [Anaerolineaceae bacterium]
MGRLSRLTSTRTSHAWSVMRNIGQNPVVLFTASRYLGYAMQFVRGILVAKFLGPYLFGIWGFLTLMQQYLMYTGFGFQHAINVELAVNALSDKERQAKYINVAWTMTLLIAVLLAVIGAYVQFRDVPLFTKYNFYQYTFALSLIVGLSHLKEVFSNIYRVYGQLNRIMLGEILVATLPLIVVFFYRDEALILAVLAATCVSSLIAILIFIIRPPFALALEFDFPAAWQMMAIGIPLLVYTLSYALITTMGRTVVSIFYSVEELGYFSLANSITYATLLGLRAVTWVVFPSILTKTRDGLPDDEVRKIVNKVNDLYSTAVFLVVFIMILLTPLLNIFLPQYKPVVSILSVMLVMQAVLSVIFGYNTIAVARNQQLKVAGISIIAVIFITLLSGLIGLLKWDVFWIAIVMLGGSILFVVLQAQLGSRLMNNGNIQKGYLTDVLPLGSMIAMAFFVVGSIMNTPAPFGVIGLVVFLISRRHSIQQLSSFAWNKFQSG